MAEKIAFKDYTVRTNGSRSLREAQDELRRELDTRRRLFDRWVQEGKVSWTEAHDRLERLCTALKMMLQMDNIEIEPGDIDKPDM